MSRPFGVAWFAALCDDDHELLGVDEPELVSTWQHCRDIVVAAERAGFDRVLLPSGYALGIDATAFAAAIATQTSTIRLLLAVRCGELVVPQLARQLATIDDICGGRLDVNIISSELPGEVLDAGPRYQRTLEVMQALRVLMEGEPLRMTGDHVRVAVDPPRLATQAASRCPDLYFGGLSEPAREVAAQEADVYLMWPDTIEATTDTIADLRSRAARHERELRFGFRVHVVVRDSEAEARAAAAHLVSALDDREGARIRAQSLDAASVGVRRQGELRKSADDEGYVSRHLWTGIGRARSGCGAAIVGDPEQVAATLRAYAAIGIDTFILSGYPHLAEAERFGRSVLPLLDG